MHGARHDGSQLKEVVMTNKTASDVWADTTYRRISIYVVLFTSPPSD